MCLPSDLASVAETLGKRIIFTPLKNTALYGVERASPQEGVFVPFFAHFLPAFHSKRGLSENRVLHLSVLCCGTLFSGVDPKQRFGIFFPILDFIGAGWFLVPWHVRYWEKRNEVQDGVMPEDGARA